MGKGRSQSGILQPPIFSLKGTLDSLVDKELLDSLVDEEGHLAWWLNVITLHFRKIKSFNGHTRSVQATYCMIPLL